MRREDEEILENIVVDYAKEMRRITIINKPIIVTEEYLLDGLSKKIKKEFGGNGFVIPKTIFKKNIGEVIELKTEDIAVYGFIVNKWNFDDLSHGFKKHILDLEYEYNGEPHWFVPLSTFSSNERVISDFVAGMACFGMAREPKLLKRKGE